MESYGTIRQELERSDFYKTMGENIRTHRKAKKLSQEELAEKLGYSRPALTNIESGKQRLAVHSILPICKIFGITIDELIKGTANRSTPPQPTKLQEYYELQRQACLKTLATVNDAWPEPTGDQQKIEVLTATLTRLKRHVGMFLKAEIDGVLQSVKEVEPVPAVSIDTEQKCCGMCITGIDDCIYGDL